MGQVQPPPVPPGTVSITNAHLEFANIPFEAVSDHGFEQALVRPRWGGEREWKGMKGLVGEGAR